LAYSEDRRRTLEAHREVSGKEVPSMKGLIAGAVLLLVAVVVLQSLPDFQRYQQLRDM
jgi:hypothetical protein